MKLIPIHDGKKKIYDICLDNSYAHLAELLQPFELNGHKICIVTDSEVAPIYLEEIRHICEPLCTGVVDFIFESGEQQKNLSTIQNLYTLLIEEHFDRKDLLIALGGGVTGDMTGFAAATYLRGISFIQLPTTLLAQADSSIGGKTGVDFEQYKNMVGAFWQPKLVYMNLKTLETLEPRQFYAGMAEIIKHGLIKDAGYYHWLEENTDNILMLDYNTLEYMIERSCQIKRDVVENDPKETGERAILNFGHTVGHSIEKLMDFKWLHGECVAVGVMAAAQVSKNRGWISDRDIRSIKHIFSRFALPYVVVDMDDEKILEVTKLDKKMDAGKIKFILLKSIGEAVIDNTVSDTELLKGIGACL